MSAVCNYIAKLPLKFFDTAGPLVWILSPELLTGQDESPPEDRSGQVPLSDVSSESQLSFDHRTALCR